MKLNTKKIIYVGFAFLLIQVFWQVYDQIIAKMLIDSFGLNQTLSGVVMALDNIVAIILLPIFGALSDKTKTKYGKRTPYIFIGTIVAAFLFTGVSLFDNAQNAKVREENIKPIVTIIAEKDMAYTVKVLANEDNNDSIKSFFTNLFGSQEAPELKDKIVIASEGQKIFSFEADGNITYYESKELATQVRAPYVADIRAKNITYFIGFIVMLFFVLIAMSTFRTPAVSLMPDVTPKPLRSKANAIINLMGAVGGITSLLLMSIFAKDYESYTILFIVVSIIMIACLIFFVIKVKEPKLVEEMHQVQKEYNLEDETDNNQPGDDKMPKDVRKSFALILASIIFWFMAYNGATSKFSVYASNVLDTGYNLPLLIANGAAIICYIPIGIISSKVGRKKTILAGIIILFTAFLIASFIRENAAFLIIITMALAGVGWATINVNSYPMIVEMSRGGNVGKYTGIYYTASMAAQIITPVLSGMLMDAFKTMTVLFPYCVFFSILAFITMSFVKHGDSKPIPTSKIEAFESLDD